MTGKPDQMIDLLPDVCVLSESGVELNHDPVQTILKKNNPLTDVSLLAGGFGNNFRLYLNVSSLMSGPKVDVVKLFLRKSRKSRFPLKLKQQE